MKKAKVQVVKGKLKVLEHHQDFEVYSRVLFPGYTLMLPLKVEKVEKGILEIESRQIRIVPSVLPFSQGKLIEEMKRKGIGRPSTYAKIVNTLLERGYVVDRKNFLYPTRLGFNVFTFLNRNYPLYCDEDFTRLLEEEMDLIEEGKRSVEEVIDKIIKSGGIEKFFS
jgi:reverse gyrase